jgi:hypothetical protein
MSEPASPVAEVRAEYRERLSQLAAERDRAAAASRRLALYRGITFVIGTVALILAAWPGAERSALLAAIGFTAIVVFIALVRRHELVERRRAEIGFRVEFNEEGLARLDRRWADLVDRSGEPDPEHAYAPDLGLVGTGSLMHLAGGWCTPLGRSTLSGWLHAPAEPEAILARHQAVAALGPARALRETLAAAARPLDDANPDRFAAFNAWAAGPRWFTSAALRPWTARILTALIGAGIVLHASGVVDWAVWLPPMAAGWAMTAMWRRRAHEVFGRADPGRRLFAGIAPLLEAAAGVPDSGRLGAIRTRLGAGPRPAHAAIGRLESLLAAADARHMWLHFVLQTLTLWDFHVVAALERWQHESGEHAAEWLEALGELEALAALGLLQHEHPHWCVPSVTHDSPRRLSAAGMVHPLLPPDDAVPNDVEVGPPGTVLVITGSNMSGKSTLLRAAGLNAVLAQAGAPVAATALSMPPAAIATCMRVEDSLAAGVSYFMAELLRLRRVAEAVETAHSRDMAAIYLIDEILQGTNTAERRVAAVHVIGRLVGSGAIGAVTTHDLDLADAEELRSAAREVHFEERVDPAGETMSFDYRLKQGRATSVNALRLMRMVGL